MRTLANIVLKFFYSCCSQTIVKTSGEHGGDKIGELAKSDPEQKKKIFVQGHCVPFEYQKHVSLQQNEKLGDSAAQTPFKQRLSVTTQTKTVKINAH